MSLIIEAIGRLRPEAACSINATSDVYEDVVWQNEIDIPSEEEVRQTMAIIAEEKLTAKQIKEAKDYLNSTDWIIAKINEILVVGTAEELIAVKEQYAEELTKRAEARELINKLEL